MSRVIGKRAIVAGLVHVPVEPCPGARTNALALDGIDRRDLSPVARPARATRARARRKSCVATAPAAERAIVVAGVEITHAGRPIAGEGHFTKLDLARYVERVADLLLPQVSRRPQSLVRCPGSDFGRCFYQRHEAGASGRAGKAPKANATSRTDVPFIRLADVRALVAAVQDGAFEFHTWGSSLPRVDRPDRIVLDLDPDPALPWPAFREACELTRAMLDRLDLAWFVKTTGGKGLHFVLPLEPRFGWGEVRETAQGMARKLAEAAPSLFVATMSKAARKGRVFVDGLRNAEGATAVAAWSPRARPGLPVSMPIAWEALDRDVRGDHFNIGNVPGIVARRRVDPWAGYQTVRQRISAAHRRALAPSR